MLGMIYGTNEKPGGPNVGTAIHCNTLCSFPQLSIVSLFWTPSNYAYNQERLNGTFSKIFTRKLVRKQWKCDQVVHFAVFNSKLPTPCILLFPRRRWLPVDQPPPHGLQDLHHRGRVRRRRLQRRGAAVARRHSLRPRGRVVRHGQPGMGDTASKGR